MSLNPTPSREELAFEYLEQLPYAPYPVQEQAIFRYFEAEQGVLVCAPTGTGKTLIAEALAYEALRTNRVMYYTTPLIALTDQKFHELQLTAERWGFSRDDVGLVTGNRRVNPNARVLVVVAEILLNRLLQPEQFNFDNVSGVVMDEFHSFSDPERGIVWEFSLALLPRHVRLLLLSATVGNAVDFLLWLERGHQRRLELVQSTERKVPLRYLWTADRLLNELLEELAAGDAEHRRTPALVFCFNRDECWNVAEELKGKSMLAEGQQKLLVDKLAPHDWSRGAGPKLKQILLRGVGVHHAGLLPRYRRVVESLFQQKLLSVCVCTETLSAGINLPARSVVLPSLMKGPAAKQKLIDPSTAHQIFGRAGRPQFDSEGFVYALPHEDDVKILRWKEKYDQIPEDTKDPGLRAAKKALKKKQPTRSPTRQYWNEAQFDKLRAAPPKDLASQGPLPWRMLAYMLQLSPEVHRIRTLVDKRLLDPRHREAAQKHLQGMLLTLHAADVIRLDPPPPIPDEAITLSADNPAPHPASTGQPSAPPRLSPMARLILEALQAERAATGQAPLPAVSGFNAPRAEYAPVHAHPTDKLRAFFAFRSIPPLFALFLLEHLAIASEHERLQALEATLELPRSMLRYVRVPPPHRLPPGPLATTWADLEIVSRGLLPAGDLYPPFDPDIPFEERKYAPALGEKLRMLFESEYPSVTDLRIEPVWVAPDVLEFGGDFHKYISGRDLAKQEGLIFRHLLRLILLLGEFSQATPTGLSDADWRAWCRNLANTLTATCRAVDPNSTETTLAHAADADPFPDLALHNEPANTPDTPRSSPPVPDEDDPADFAAGLLDDE